MDIFDLLIENRFKFDKKKPLKLFEAFAGIGTQHMALKRLGIDVDVVGISEIDKYALESYEAIHGQDLSLAGKGKGITKKTRSGLVYDVIRILEEMDNKPKVLLMENVPALLNKRHYRAWREVYQEILDLGYSNYVEVLNAKDFGIPQIRKRVFMISILGDYNYSFPKGFNSNKVVLDYLEDEVDEKYYLSDEMIFGMLNTNFNQYKLENNIINPNESINTLVANYENAPQVLAIKENTNLGYSLAEVGDGVYIDRPHQKRGVVQKQLIQTLKTSGSDIGVVVNNARIINPKVNYKQPSLQDRIYDSKYLTTTITTSFHPNYAIVNDNDFITIRKLTPKECWRLMGIKDEDFNKAENAGLSNSQLYKQAGNAIVVDVLYYIFKELFNQKGKINMNKQEQIKELEKMRDYYNYGSGKYHLITKAIIELRKELDSDERN